MFRIACSYAVYMVTPLVVASCLMIKQGHRTLTLDVGGV
jgi:hypothetical protein